MPSLIFTSFLASSLRGRINVDQDEFGVMLLDEGYTPSKGAHARRSDVSPYEIEGQGYDRGGISTEVSLSEDDSGEAVELRLGSARWDRATLTAAYAAYFRKSADGEEDDDLVAVIDFGGPAASTRGPFDIEASVLRIEN